VRIIITDTTLSGPLIGGGHLFLPKLLRGLIQHYYEVHLVTSGEPHERIRELLQDTGVTIHSDIWNKHDFVERSSRVFAKWINEIKPDVYLVSASQDIGWVALPLLDPGIVTLTIGHTDDETFYLPARHYSSFLTGAIGVSREICESYIDSCKLDASMVTWIPYGVETAGSFREETETERLRIIYAGRVEEEQKRISDLIAIAKILTERDISYELCIVGDGSEMPRLKQKLGGEIARGSVILYGWLNGTDVITLMRESDIFLLTSDYEGFCIALVEAMANGCCPVVSDIRSGNKDLVVNGENGFLVPVGDINGFIQRLTALRDDPVKLRNLRRSAWEKGRDFTVQRMVDKYAGFFNTAMKLARENPRELSPGFPLLPTCRSKYPDWMRNLKVMARKAVSKFNK